MKQKQNYALILASGGIDSTACIRFYKKMKFEVEAIFIDYGQLAAKNELRSIRSIAKFYKIKLKKVVVKSNSRYKDGVIEGRNAFLYFIGLMNFSKPNGTLASGVHNGTNYYDCSLDFIEAIEGIFKKYTQGTVAVGAPFLNFNKREIFDYCKIEKIPLSLTYSCELGGKQNCGKCNTCKDLNLIYASEKH